MVDFLQNTLDGLMFGAAYALLGLGFTLTFGVMRRLNLSYGPTLMVGVYAGTWVSLNLYRSLPVALVVTVIVAVTISIVIERVSFRWVKSDSPLTSMVSAFALWMVLEEIIVLLTWGRRFPVENPLTIGALTVGPFYVRGDYLALFLAGLVLMALVHFLVFRTPFGRKVRAVAENPAAARVIGINVSQISSRVFALVAGLGGLMAFFIASSLHQITPHFGLWATVKGLIVMVLGGLGSIPGAIAGGLLLGVVESQALWYLGAGYRDLVAYLLLFILLVAMPQGLFRQGKA